MNFGGYVALRRGLLAHLQDGRLSNAEALALTVLIMLADKSTGAGTINAPTLRTFLPELSYDAAKRILLSLEEKRYIYRKIIPFSTRVYPYWVNKYVPSTGPHKLLQTDLSQVFESKNIKDIRYGKSAPDPALEGALEGAPDPAPHYKNGKGKQEKEKTTLPDTSSVVPHPSPHLVPHTERTSSAPDATGGAEPSRNHEGAMCGTIAEPSREPCAEPAPRDPADVGLKWSGFHGAYLDTATGRELTWDEAQQRLGKGINIQ